MLAPTLLTARDDPRLGLEGGRDGAKPKKMRQQASRVDTFRQLLCKRLGIACVARGLNQSMVEPGWDLVGQ